MEVRAVKKGEESLELNLFLVCLALELSVSLLLRRTRFTCNDMVSPKNGFKKA